MEHSHSTRGQYDTHKSIGIEAKSHKFSKEDKFHNKLMRPSTPGPSEKLTDKLIRSRSQGNLSKTNSNYISENTLKNTIYKSNNFPGPACYTPKKIISSVGTT